MAEASIARVLRSGAADGEHAAAVMVINAVDTTAGLGIFRHFVESLVANLASGAAQAKGLVLVASSSSPQTYSSVLRNVSSSCFQVLDCFSDPLGWERLISPNTTSLEEMEAIDVRKLSSLFSKIHEAGKVFADKQPKGRFAVAIDSLTFFMRHHSLAAVSSFICQLRALDSVSAILWFTDGGLHQARVLDALEYNATATAFVEPQLDFLDTRGAGRLRIRHKRRNGRVSEKVDEFRVEVGRFNFFPVELGTKVDNVDAIHKVVELSFFSEAHGFVWHVQVQFRLHLSDKEVEDRSRVRLPFEHQGDGQEVRIYDGRQSEAGVETKSSSGSIHYLRDSDDEMPDSDEDPDDDLDI
ncbi:elongator complex protein 5 isoform X1 [Selaginella moellendorffii]|uniref:elongator complex protein 5 isoform X1 n=1 Tax=Selaginella moellendorffii TaxID=88036 RepID=UPI000D1C7E59|nr:elongator complex protein 5 isoform X1 [Selaginella moellendorffii]|eukprot:XP_024518756.1 elongator complex protein 5 isoform X1 [Selaginella moellendorffii]